VVHAVGAVVLQGLSVVRVGADIGTDRGRAGALDAQVTVRVDELVQVVLVVAPLETGGNVLGF